MFTLEGFWRFFLWAGGVYTGRVLIYGRQLLLTGCGDGEGQVALVYAKWSLAPLLTEKHYGFEHLSLQPAYGLLLAIPAARCLPDASQMHPRIVFF